MGLDMFAYKKRKDEEETQEIFYWRKFNALHGFFEDLYEERGGEEVFNCVPLQLSHEDLDKLEKATLVPREGFFFGPREITLEETQTIPQFILEARKALEEGYEVYYNSWW